MISQAEAIEMVRSLLEESAGFRPEIVFPVERAMYKGYMALGPDKAYFMRDRFGKLEPDGEYPYGDAEKVE